MDEKKEFNYVPKHYQNIKNVGRYFKDFFSTQNIIKNKSIVFCMPLFLLQRTENGNILRKNK